MGYESDKRIPNVSSRIQLPDNTSNCWNYCPDMLIFYLSLPTEAPSLGFSHNVDDGLGIVLICYFKLKDSTKEIFQNLQNENKKSELESSSLDNNNDNDDNSNHNNNRINAIKLFTQWVKRSPTDPSFQGRFKLIPISNNLEEVGVPTYMQKYKNKPLLIKRSGTTGLFTSLEKQNILEFEVNFYPFPYLAKQGLSYLRSHYLCHMDLSLAFVIEGRCDEELPEVVVGCVNISKQDLDLMPKIHG